MDLNAVETYRRARTRADLALAAGEVPLAGGTLLFSAPSPLITGLVDITTLGWPDLEPSADGLRIGATCPIARLVAFAECRDALRPDPTWTAVPLFADAAHALLASFKIWNTATVGGNVRQCGCRPGAPFCPHIRAGEAARTPHPHWRSAACAPEAPPTPPTRRERTTLAA